MKQTVALNSVQRHLIQMFSFCQSEDMLADLKSVLLKHYSELAQKGIDEYWDANGMNEDSVEQILNEHLRTPYVH